MRPRAILPVVAAVVLVRCAAAPQIEVPEPPPPAPAPEPLVPGLERLDAADYEGALQLLLLDVQRCAGQPAGRRAALVGAALALDPRNPDPDPDLAADLVQRVLAGETAAWERPIAESLYLFALELGAEPRMLDEVADTVATDRMASVVLPTCESPAELLTLPGTELPELARPSLMARYMALEARGDSLARLTETMAAELVEVRQELERIRRVLRPPTDTLDGPAGPER